jgi:glycosyltransferase involved in cell wall biosynthesis
LISVLILTLNEEQDLPGCLASVSWSDDIHVFDSFSSDQTQEIARRHGAHVTERQFDSYAGQRNAALRSLPFKHDWLFILDADERPSPELAREMRNAVSVATADTSGFSIRRRDFFQGRWLKHAQITPWYIRLVRHESASYTRAVNEVLRLDGATAILTHCIDHYPFSKGIGHWIDKHNLYSTMEAELLTVPEAASWKQALFAGTFHERRQAQKAIFMRMPARPILKWFYMMFWRGAVLDGKAGVNYAFLQCIYEYFIVLKQRENAELAKTKDR